MIKKFLFGLYLVVWFITMVMTFEICARTGDSLRYHAPFFGNYSMDSLYMYDELGKYGRPNSSFKKWHLNELGYRGPSLRQGTYRIACIGSSETFGLYESDQNEWPRQLESILKQDANSHEYEVVNVAFPGLSMATSLERLPQVLAGVNPRLVVIYPSYTGYIDDDQPEPWPSKYTAHPKPVFERPHFQFRSTELLVSSWKHFMPVRAQDWIRSLQLRYESRGIKAIPRLREENISAFRIDLEHLTEELQSRGIKVVLVTHSNRFGTGPITKEDAAYLTAWRKFYPNIEEQGLLDMESRMSAAMRSVGEDRDIPVVDAANLIPPGSQDFAEFVHFTDAGARALATLVAHQVESETHTPKQLPEPSPRTY